MEKLVPTEQKPPTPVATHIPVEPILTPPMTAMRKFPNQKKSMRMTLGLLIIAGLLGVGTGYTFAKKGLASSSQDAGMAAVTSKNSVATDTEVGSNDTTAFPDTAEGVLKEGGIEGEGTHHLDRGMGANKDVYLSSTVINLQNFVGKKVEVRGQTISGKKAGWLMDVGKVKIIQ